MLVQAILKTKLKCIYFKNLIVRFILNKLILEKSEKISGQVYSKSGLF